MSEADAQNNTNTNANLNANANTNANADADLEANVNVNAENANQSAAPPDDTSSTSSTTTDNNQTPSSSSTSSSSSSSSSPADADVETISSLANKLLVEIQKPSFPIDRLRWSLSARGLDSTGLRPALLKRLRDYVTANEINDHTPATLEEEELLQGEGEQDKEGIRHEQTPAPTTTTATTTTATTTSSTVIDSKIFVGQLPSDYSEDSVKALFAPFGNISEIVLLRHHDSNKSKGCGFVTFQTRASADNAVRAHHGITKLPGSRKEMVVRIHDPANPYGHTFDETASANATNPAYPYASSSSYSSSSSSSSGVSGSEVKVYIGYLSRQSTADDVRRIVSPYGTPTDIFMMVDRSTNTFKGVSFVKFATKHEAMRVIEALGGKYTDKDASQPLQVRVAHSQDSKAATGFNRYGQVATTATSYRNYLHPSATPGAYGSAHTQHASYLDYLPQSQSSSSSSSSAATAAAAYNASHYAAYYAAASAAGYATPSSTTSSSVTGHYQSPMAQAPPNSNLFVYSIPETYSDSDLQSMFTDFGTIVSSKIQRDPTTGASKGYGFVSFDNPTSAQLAIQSLDGFVIGSKRLSVRLKGPKEQRPKPY